VPYLNCPSCRLSIGSVVAYSLDRDWPRCKTISGREVPMFASSLPDRVAGGRLDESMDAAIGTSLGNR
jgi:hypothetical protein